MYLMEVRELLDAHVFHKLQKIAKPIVTNTVVPCIFYIFVSFYLFYTYLELTCVCCSKSFCRKKDSQSDRKKEIKAMKEERELFFACYILDIYCSLALFIEKS